MSKAIFVTLEIPFHEKWIHGFTSGVWEAFGRQNDRMFVRIYTPISRTSSFYFPPPLGHTHDESLYTYDSACYVYRAITRTPPLNGVFEQIHGLSKMQILQLTNWLQQWPKSKCCHGYVIGQWKVAVAHPIRITDKRKNQS